MSDSSTKPEAARILLLGKLPTVLHKTLRTLRTAGFDAEGTTQLATVHAEFNARDFTLIGLGGAFSNEQRQALKRVFYAQNPVVRVLDLFAPILLPQLRYLTCLDALPPVIEHLSTTLTKAGLKIGLHARKESLATITLYDYTEPFEVEQLLQGNLSAGTTSFEIPRQPGKGFPHFIVVYTDSGEVQVHRFEL